MTPLVKKFIENHLDQIDANEFEDLYFQLERDVLTSLIDCGIFTTVLLEAGINPIEYCTHIPDGMFYNHTFTSFIIPKHIKGIDPYAFGKCFSLEEIEIPRNIEIIFDNAFAYCRNLKRVIFTDPNVTIARKTFFRDDFIEEVIYNGTMSQFKKFCYRCDNPANIYGAPIIKCTDGIIDQRS